MQLGRGERRLYRPKGQEDYEGLQRIPSRVRLGPAKIGAPYVAAGE